MRKISFILLLATFLFNCSQRIGVGLKDDFRAEIQVETGQNYPELNTTDIIQKIQIGDKNFVIETINGKEQLTVPGEYGKLLEQGQAKPVGDKDWQITYDKADQILYFLPPTDTLRITCKKQNPENFDSFINFTKEDLDSISVLFKNKPLPSSRLNIVSSGTGYKPIMELHIPSWESIKPSDYKIQISRPFYEDYLQSISSLKQNELRLGLSQSELQIQLINKESSVFIPEKLYLKNAAGKTETYLTTEIEGGVNLYDLEFPVQVYGSKYRWQFFNHKDEKIEAAVYTKPGNYKLYYLEKERELPIILYDISRDQIDRSLFENWVLNKMEKIDNIFLYITNGYESVFNTENVEYKNILNKIYRIHPRTSNILESLDRFSLILKRKDILEKYLNSPAQYGNKLSPHYYLFLSGDNVERLSTAISHLLNKISQVQISRQNLTICIDSQYKNSQFSKQINNSNIELKYL
ncbi:MAG: hypothetical protein K9M80_01940 [Candidatus Marinimicrobia bacterium]|nr:hypothetical protein [Candidatus Neomarinimicrobiota bacterium]